MMTLIIGPTLLLQLPRNHVSVPLPESCQLRLTGSIGGAQVLVAAQVQALSNCYLLTTSLPSSAGRNAILEVLVDAAVAYRCEVFLQRESTSASDE